MMTGPKNTIYIVLDRWSEVRELIAELDELLKPVTQETYKAYRNLIQLRQELKREIETED